MLSFLQLPVGQQTFSLSCSLGAGLFALSGTELDRDISVSTRFAEE